MLSTPLNALEGVLQAMWNFLILYGPYIGLAVSTVCAYTGGWVMSKDKHLRKGYQEGWQDYQKMFNNAALPSKYTQRTLQAVPTRQARVSKGRIMARRQPPAEPRK